MTVRIGETGKEIYVGTGFDMSNNTELTLSFKSPDGSIQFTRSSADGVTAPSIASPSIGGVGILPADTYFFYETQSSDFSVSGSWCVEGIYTEGTVNLYIGDAGTLNVKGRC